MSSNTSQKSGAATVTRIDFEKFQVLFFHLIWDNRIPAYEFYTIY